MMGNGRLLPDGRGLFSDLMGNILMFWFKSSTVIARSASDVAIRTPEERIATPSFGWFAMTLGI
jgi:hypothetical protein